MNTNRFILALEDDQLEAMTLRRAFFDAHITNPLHIVSTGQEAVDFLLDESRANPTFILLDLNMPGMTGLEFLRLAKAHNGLKRIPVIVLTTSNQEQDRNQSFDLNVAGYIIKPIDYDKFVDIVKIIHMYWSINELPTSGREYLEPL
jgi:CheY-like chemotaxis protein